MNNNFKTFIRLIKLIYNESRVTFCLILFFSILFKLLNIYATGFIKKILDTAIIAKDIPLLIKYTIFLAIIYLITAISSQLNVVLSIPLSQKVILNLRKKAMNKLVNLPIRYFDTNEHGKIMSNFTNDIEVINDFVEYSFFYNATAILEIIATILFMFYLSPILATVVIVFLVICLLITYIFGKYSIHLYDTQQSGISDINAYIEEMVKGHSIVKLFNYEKRNFKMFNKINNNYLKSSVKANIFSNSIFPIIATINYVQYVTIAIIGTYAIYSNISNVTIGTIGSFLILCRTLSVPIFSLAFEITFITRAIAGAKRVFNAIDQNPEIDEGRVNLKDNKWILEDGTEVECRSNIEFRNVNFSYDPGKKILKNINMYAKNGQKVALVGPTGSGKTTITNLITRFYELDSGQILLDGIDIRRINKYDLRKNITIVLQDSVLFTDTILNNIRYCDDNIKREDVIKASIEVGADHFISQLDKGYDTMLDSSVESLSQGQKQLICLARAKLRNTPILILDEATSNIDTLTEQIVGHGMDKLMHGKTVFVIAHRLSTIINSDVIMVIENGEIIERGNHQDLLEKNGVYAKLYRG